MCRNLFLLLCLSPVLPPLAAFGQGDAAPPLGATGIAPLVPGSFGEPMPMLLLEEEEEEGFGCGDRPTVWLDAIPLEANEPGCAVPGDWAPMPADLPAAAQRIADLTEQIRWSPCDARAYNRRAVAWAQRGLATAPHSDADLMAAKADLDEALRLDPSFGLAYFNRGVLNFLDARQQERALGDFFDAVRLSPGSPAAYLGRGLAFASNARPERGQEDMTTALRLDPNFRCARTNLVSLIARTQAGTSQGTQPAAAGGGGTQPAAAGTGVTPAVVTPAVVLPPTSPTPEERLQASLAEAAIAEADARAVEARRKSVEREAQAELARLRAAYERLGYLRELNKPAPAPPTPAQIKALEDRIQALEEKLKETEKLLLLDGEARVESVRAAIAKAQFEAAKSRNDLQKLLQPTP